MSALNFEHIRSRLKSRIHRSSTHNHQSGLKPAAVLILIYPGPQELELVLTRRCEHLQHHAGQISFPGGRIEHGDESCVSAALREAEEEIGLESNSVEVLGMLEATVLPSGFSVSPVVGLMENRPEFIPSPDEVAEVIALPLSIALDSNRYKRDKHIRNGIKRSFYYIEYKEYYVWGATAGILFELAAKLSPELSPEL